jgi:hypothetical protein
MAKELTTVSDICSYIMRQTNGRLDENDQAFWTTAHLHLHLQAQSWECPPVSTST